MRRNRYGKTAVTGAFLLTGALAVMASSTGGNSGLFTPAQTKHWAFQKIKTVEPPAVKEAGWVKNPIDSFIAAKLESRGVRPNPPADKITLLRRVTFDLTGLPPTPDEVDAFVADTTPKAFEKVVDRLLASPRYGERWARHWLDLARYAESEGFKSDETRPNAWRYRDYVIKSFNDNKPYDRFVKEQIAGDELWPDDPDARIATAFLRHYPDESNARNLMQRRQEILDDVTDTTALTFMGLTYGCARCHNHKYDPILQADYYRLQAFFANTAAADEIALWPAEKARAHREALAVWEEKTKPIREEMAALLEPHKQKVLKEFVDKYPAEIQAILSKSPAERNPYEWQMYYKAKPYLVVDDNDAARRLKGEQKQRYEALKADLKKFDDINPGEAPMGIGMRDISASAPATHILSGGVYSNPTVEVQPGFLTLLDPNPAKIAPPPGLKQHRAAHGARGLAHRSLKPADRARDG